MREEHLLLRLRAGQQSALEELMRQYNRYVCAVISRVLSGAGGPEDIEELSQDTFMAVWSHADAIQGNLKAYLCTTARNKAKSFLRSCKPIPMGEDMVDFPDPGLSLEDEAQKKELSRCLQRAIRKMPARDQEIFLRHYYYLESTSDIAARLEIPVSTVCSRLARGRKLLKKMLSKEGFC